jgi:hypothetical protein
MFNWPEDGTIGSTVKLIYHVLLEENRKIMNIQQIEDRYEICFEGEDWPQILTLVPKRNKDGG